MYVALDQRVGEGEKNKGNEGCGLVWFGFRKEEKDNLVLLT